MTCMLDASLGKVAYVQENIGHASNANLHQHIYMMRLEGVTCTSVATQLQGSCWTYTSVITSVQWGVLTTKPVHAAGHLQNKVRLQQNISELDWEGLRLLYERICVARTSLAGVWSHTGGDSGQWHFGACTIHPRPESNSQTNVIWQSTVLGWMPIGRLFEKQLITWKPIGESRPHRRVK